MSYVCVIDQSTILWIRNHTQLTRIFVFFYSELYILLYPLLWIVATQSCIEICPLGISRLVIFKLCVCVFIANDFFLLGFSLFHRYVDDDGCPSLAHCFVETIKPKCVSIAVGYFLPELNTYMYASEWQLQYRSYFFF